MTNTQQVECPKCDSRGKIRAFGHIENGKCFLCGGTGKLDASKVRKSKRVEQSAQTKAERTAAARKLYLSHYEHTRKHVPGLTLADFKEMARLYADMIRVEDGHAELNEQCWVGGAFYVAVEYRGT